MKIVAFGDVMLGLFVQTYNRIEQSPVLEVNPACSELNTVLVASQLGLKGTFVTKITDNVLGHLVINKIKEHDIDTSYTIWTEEGRVGIMYADLGASPHQTEVLYDRAGSSMQTFGPSEINWKSVLIDAKVLHVSGITPGLSCCTAKATLKAMKIAKELDVSVSFDVNYRRIIWSEDRARNILSPMMKYVDILFVTEADARRVFGISDYNVEAAARELSCRFGIDCVVVSLRTGIGTSIWRNARSGIAVCAGKVYRDKWYDLEVVGRLGSGDAFAGGFLFGYLALGPKEALRFGNIASSMKQTSPGPLSWLRHEEVKFLAGS